MDQDYTGATEEALPINLKNFINSGFTILPSNFNRHSAGDALGHRCPLCGRTHAKAHSFPYYLVSEESPQFMLLLDSEGVHICANCDIIVDRAHTNMLLEKAPKKLQFFIRGNTGLPIGVINYFTHIPANRKKYCFFCERWVGDAPANEIEVPMGGMSAAYVDNGHIHVCTTCMDTYKSIMGGESLRNVLQEGDIFDNCPECHVDYRITKNEKEVRFVQRTTGNHLCGPCFYQRREHGLELDLEKILIRMDTMICASCNDFSVAIDRTLSQEYMETNLPTLLNCAFCLENGQSPLQLIKPRSGYIRIYPHGSNYLVKISSNSEDQTVKRIFTPQELSNYLNAKGAEGEQMTLFDKWQSNFATARL